MEMFAPWWLLYLNLSQSKDRASCSIAAAKTGQ